jgi:hypothetical protein
VLPGSNNFFDDAAAYDVQVQPVFPHWLSAIQHNAPSQKSFAQEHRDHTTALSLPADRQRPQCHQRHQPEQQRHQRRVTFDDSSSSMTLLPVLMSSHTAAGQTLGGTLWVYKAPSIDMRGSTWTP